jgi:hypothetical protein
MRLAALCVLATLGYALFVQAQQPERICTAAAKAAACANSACAKSACGKAACAQTARVTTACDKSACETTACAKTSCEKSACEVSACPALQCDKSTSTESACEKGTCAASACDSPRCEVSACASDACSDACATDFAAHCANTTCDTAACPSDCAADSDEAEKLEHLSRAAEHLQAAGLDEHADQVRQCAQRLRDRLLEAKIAELKQLEREVAALQTAVGGPRQIMLKFQIVEVSVTNLKALGFDLHALGGSCDQGELARTLLGQEPAAEETVLTTTACDTKGALGLFNALQHEDYARVLAAPTVVTVERRAAQFETMGSWGAGTKVNALPELLSGERVKLEVRVGHREFDPSLNVLADGKTIPGFRVREIDTGAEMKLGQTLVIAGPRQKRMHMQRVGVPYAMDLPVVGYAFCHKESKINEVATLYLVTPELVEGVALNGPMPVPMTATRPAPEPQRRLMR